MPLPRHISALFAAHGHPLEETVHWSLTTTHILVPGSSRQPYIPVSMCAALGLGHEKYDSTPLVQPDTNKW